MVVKTIALDVYLVNKEVGTIIWFLNWKVAFFHSSRRSHLATQVRSFYVLQPLKGRSLRDVALQKAIELEPRVAPKACFDQILNLSASFWSSAYGLFNSPQQNQGSSYKIDMTGYACSYLNVPLGLLSRPHDHPSAAAFCVA